VSFPPERRKCELPPWVAQVKARLVGKHYGPAFLLSALFFEGRPSLFFPDSRWPPLVSLVGPTHRLLCRLNPNFLKPGGCDVRRVVEDPKLPADLTCATLAHVHTSPRKSSCAWAPRSRSSGTLARCSSLKRGSAPGGGLCLKPSTPSSSLARFTSTG
jgi:hypothetical protein